MAYDEQDWVDEEVGGTAVDAARMNHIEGGIAAAATVADGAATAVASLATSTTTALAAKADASAMTTALAAKADAAATTTALAAKADTSTVNTELALKADTTAVTTALTTKADLVSGKVPTSQLPAIPTFVTHPVSSQSAMLALTAAVGDVAVRSDISNARFLLIAEPPSSIGNWLLLNSDPTAAVDSINGHVGVVVLGPSDVGADAAGSSATENARATAAEALLAPKASPALTGFPIAPTPATSDSSTAIATTALVANKITALGLLSASQHAAADFLLAANNLSDVASAGSARQNLHVPILGAAMAVQTTNVASLSGLPTVGTYTFVNNDIILLTGQTTASQNGLWQMPATGTGAWTRPSDFPSGTAVKGRVVPVMDGSEWSLITTSTVTIDTTAQVWQQVNRVANDLRYILSDGGASTAWVLGTSAPIGSVWTFQGSVYVRATDGTGANVDATFIRSHWTLLGADPTVVGGGELASATLATTFTQATTVGTWVDVTGWTVAPIIPSSGRGVYVDFFCAVDHSVANGIALLRLFDVTAGAVAVDSTGTTLGSYAFTCPGAAKGYALSGRWRIAPAGGSRTYKVQASVGTSNGTVGVFGRDFGFEASLTVTAR